MKLVVVDMAGTVVDYGSRAPAGAFVELFARHGVTVTEAEARGPMGMHKRDHIGCMCRMPAVAARWKERHGRSCTESDIESLFQEFIPMQLDSLPNYTDVIPGAVEALLSLRNRGILIGMTTGYNVEMTNLVLESMAKQGFRPDTWLCAAQVPQGRPAPWMIYGCMQAVDVYPAEAVVKVGDTIVDIEDGLNAGCWSVGVVKTGNMIGLSEEEFASLPTDEQKARIKAGSEGLERAGAHFVIDSVAHFTPALTQIECRLSQGIRP